jgi:hypothetical protein
MAATISCYSMLVSHVWQRHGIFWARYLRTQRLLRGKTCHGSWKHTSIQRISLILDLFHLLLVVFFLIILSSPKAQPTQIPFSLPLSQNLFHRVYLQYSSPMSSDTESSHVELCFWLVLLQCLVSCIPASSKFPRIDAILAQPTRSQTRGLAPFIALSSQHCYCFPFHRLSIVPSYYNYTPTPYLSPASLDKRISMGFHLLSSISNLDLSFY